MEMKDKGRDLNGNEFDFKTAEVKDIFVRSDIHGFNDLYEAHNIYTKLVWAVVLAVAAGFMLYGFIQAVTDYNKRSVLTSYSIVVPANGMPFPDVRLCPVTSSGLNLSHVGNVLGHNSPLYQYLIGPNRTAPIKFNSESILKDSRTLDYMDKNEKLLEFFWNTTWNSKEKMNSQDFFLKFGYQRDAFFKECSFGDKKINCSSITQTIYDLAFGNCFVVHVGANQIGVGQGLKLVLDLDLKNTFHDSGITQTVDGVSYSKFLYFLVQPPGFIEPLPEYTQNAYASPGMWHYLNLETKHFKMVNDNIHAGGQDCISATEGQELLKLLDGNYTTLLCKVDCLLRAAMQILNCTFAIDRMYWKTNMIESYNICNDSYGPASEASGFTQWTESCVASCKTPCHNWQHTTTQSSLKFPSLYWEGKLGSEEYEHLKNNYIIFDLAYYSMQYIEMEQTLSMTFNTLVCNVGGQIGLWLGGSIVAIVKLVLVLISVVTKLAKTRIRKRRQQTEREDMV